MKTIDPTKDSLSHASPPLSDFEPENATSQTKKKTRMKTPAELRRASYSISTLRHTTSRRRHSPLMLLCLVLHAPFVVSPMARAVCQDGCPGNSNTFLGENALLNTSGSFNTAIGSAALNSNSIGNNNTATGANSLITNSTGESNTATGSDALYFNTTGNNNTADGSDALGYNTTGNNNTATGSDALSFNTAGSNNTASGYQALYGDIINHSTGSNNTATGAFALYSNTEGSFNVANGSAALYSNTSGIWNTAAGWGALNLNTTGSYNAANGLQALFSNTTGSYNTGNGLNALFSNTTGSDNIGLGSGAGGALTTGSDNIDIGNAGVAGESAKIRIGTKNTHKNTYIAGIYGGTVPRGLGVIVDSSGHLGTSTSSARFKEEIKPMDKASEAIHALQPVTFRYKHDLDPDRIPQFGLVAEDVEKVNPNLVAHDEDGTPYTVRYEAVNAMLLNEFLKEHRKVEEQGRKAQQQEATITDLASALTQQQKQLRALTASLKEQAAQLQTVSAQIEMSKFPPQTVVNNR